MARSHSAPALSGFARDRVFGLRVTGLIPQVALAVGTIGIATALGMAVRLVWPGALPGALIFPALLYSALAGGWRSGLAAAVFAIAARATFLRMSADPIFGTAAPSLATLSTFLLAEAVVVATGAYARSLLDQLKASRDALNEHTLHYATLFDTIPEGFAVCEVIRDPIGRVVDYTIVEINPALRRLLGVGPEVVGTRLSEARGDWTRWLNLCDRVMSTGEPISFESENRRRNLWHEVHLTRLSRSRLAQFFFDITERKASEARQAELFDELNHRVKNNLAMVASLLHLQARTSRDEVKSELAKAAARVQSIADVHGVLSRDAGANTVDFGAYLKDLCENLRHSLAIDGAMTLSVDAEPSRLSVDSAIPLGMVVNELVTNAVKYAYPAGGGGLISVGFRRDGEHMLLIVRDEGQGLPDETERRDGRLGMRLVRSLVEQVGGKLSVHSGEGVRFEIRLKNDEAGRVA